MLLAVFDKINFTAFFCLLIWNRAVNENDLNFTKQYVKRKKKFLKKNTKCEKYKKNVTNIETEKK